ncbi:hypothetical protein BH09ACT8_BH09ACT8_20560 [soil metagenome]
MRGSKPGMAALAAASCIAAGFMAAPVAGADTCDPAVTVCQGGDVQAQTASPDYAPPVVAPDEDYPFDGDFYFNSSDPLTEAEVASPGFNAGSPGGGSHGGGGGGGGGGHR